MRSHLAYQKAGSTRSPKRNSPAKRPRSPSPVGHPTSTQRLNKHNDQLDFPIWLQIVDLCQILREDNCLRTIGEHIGQVIAIDNSEAYRAKLFGPRIRILVKDIHNLPHTVVLPRLDGEGTVEYNLEYSGLPQQCGRCRSMDHQVRHCPKKESKFQRREPLPRNTPTTPTTQAPDIQINIAQPTEQPHPTEQREAMQAELETQEKTTPEDPQEPHIKETPPEIPQVQPTIATDCSPNQSPVRAQPMIATDSSPNQPPVRAHPDPSHTEWPPELLPNDTNFPQLTSPAAVITPTPPSPIHQPGTPHTFVWRQKPNTEAHATDKGKEKLTTPSTESTPITRQGYRSGRR